MNILIRGGRIVDGTGNPWFAADVHIANGIIQSIGHVPKDTAVNCRVVDASGLFVAPGFVDMHGHSDYHILGDRLARSKTLQGITTDVAGNCGYSATPQSPNAFFQEWWTPTIEERFKVVGKEQGIALLKEHGVDLNWADLSEYYALIRQNGLAVNYVSFVGHVALRLAATGDFQRKPSREELDEMKRLLGEAMEQGALGLSTECGSHRSMDFDMKEIAELCSVAKEYDGRFSFHIRDYDDHLLEAMEEALTLLEQMRIPGIISHINARGRENWGKVPYALNMMDEARANGVPVVGDVMPYGLSEALFFSPLLTDLLPEWSTEGGVEALASRLSNPEDVGRLVDELKCGGSSRFYVAKGFGDEEAYGKGPLSDPAWPHYVTVVDSKVEGVKDKTFSQIARQWSTDPFEALVRVLRMDPAAKKVISQHSEADMEAAIVHPAVGFGTDGGLVDFIKRPGLPNPTLYGAFPYVLRRYVRERGALRLEDAVRKMTSLATQSLGLFDRGLVQPGFRADLAIFDLDAISDLPNYDDRPSKVASGIRTVLVNGQIVVDDSAVTGLAPGSVILGPGVCGSPGAQ